MKILVVGDPHGILSKKIPKKIDLILITGDIGKADLARKIAFENANRRRNGLPKLKKDKQLDKKIKAEINNSTINVLRYLSKSAKVYSIAGNVGVPNSKKFNKNAKLIKNQLRNLNGLRVGFLEYFVDNCWIKEFGEKDKKRIKKAQRETARAKKVLEKFDNLDILLCHQPPFGYLDKVNFPGAPAHWKGKHAGSKVILDYIKKEQPRYVFCGHIHEAKGKTRIGKTEVYNVGSNGDYVLLNID